MNRRQRTGAFLKGVFILLLALILLADPRSGYSTVILFLKVSLFAAGINSLIYYLTMARHMVEGQMILYRAILLLDLAFFTHIISDIPRIFVILYLIGIHMVSGIIDIMGSIDSIKMRVSSWKFKFVRGTAGIGISLASIIMFRSVTGLVYIYSFGLILSGIMQIISAFRRTSIVYIQ